MTPRRKREWFDDDAMWRDIHPFLFRESRVADTAEHTRQLLRLVRPKGKAVLDLCCGPGRFSIQLARRGYRVTGVDRTRYYLAKARSGAKASRVTVEWVRQDMRDFVRPGAFDLALSMESSFGYFDEKEEDQRVLRHVLESLRPGGAFALEMLGKEQIARIFAPVTHATLPDGTLLVQRHAIFDDWTRIRNDWTLVRHGRAKTYTFHHTLFSGRELRERMEEAGFVDVRLYGGFDAREYGLRAERLLALGRRRPEGARR